MERDVPKVNRRARRARDCSRAAHNVATAAYEIMADCREMVNGVLPAAGHEEDHVTIVISSDEN